ncbi:hypothetical protein CDAR_61671 [Caerostris darwini]|uniref:Uncharacterized protein n=1 Tax=Caerostris darwini TaxID=1538125 RepID=A0AAV4NUI3_9ARAC|nr:hypothetical protein CDAR_61671 [Caerostris darwini]
MSLCSSHHGLNAESLHAFHRQRVQLLLPDDHPAGPCRWGALKATVYQDFVESSLESLLVARFYAAATMKETPSVFNSVRQLMLRPCQPCLASVDANFEPLLQH